MSEYRTERLGETVLVVDAKAEAAPLAAYLEGLNFHGVVDVVPVFDQVAVYFDTDAIDEAGFSQALGQFTPGLVAPSTHHIVPVCYGMGEDIESVAVALSMSIDEFVANHGGQNYDCKAIGFCPGFPYLGWLDKRLSGLGRLESPRLRVPVGSVALVGRMTGVYTLPRPGGWRLIGRTPLTLVDPDEGYFPISVADTVTFQPIGETEFTHLLGERL